MGTRGRPKKEDAKRKQFLFLMNDEDEDILNEVSKELHKSKAETIRFCVNFVHNALRIHRGVFPIRRIFQKRKI